jgi:hypothetical protein
MRRPQRTGVETVLPQMSAAAVAPVEAPRVGAMELPQRQGQPVGPLGHRNQVNVVAHEAIAEQPHAVPGWGQSPNLSVLWNQYDTSCCG